MKWTAERDAILREMYYDQPLDQIMAATGTSRDGIYARAKLLNLTRKRFGGFKQGHTIRRNYQTAAPKPPTLQDRVLTFLRDTDSALIARDVAKQMMIGDVACVSLALRRRHRAKEIHISEYQPKRRKHDPPFVPAYSFGNGQDATMPEPDAVERFHAPNPIPYSVLPFWHDHVFKPVPQAEGITS